MTTKSAPTTKTTRRLIGAPRLQDHGDRAAVAELRDNSLLTLPHMRNLLDCRPSVTVDELLERMKPPKLSQFILVDGSEIWLAAASKSYVASTIEKVGQKSVQVGVAASAELQITSPLKSTTK